MYNRVVYEAAQRREPSDVGHHGDDAPLLGCCEDGVFLNYFCSLSVGGFFGGHCSRLDMDNMAFSYHNLVYNRSVQASRSQLFWSTDKFQQFPNETAFIYESISTFVSRPPFYCQKICIDCK